MGPLEETEEDKIREGPEVEETRVQIPSGRTERSAEAKLWRWQVMYCDLTRVGVSGDMPGIIRGRERAQWVSYLPYRHEDLSSNLQHPR